MPKPEYETPTSRSSPPTRRGARLPHAQARAGRRRCPSRGADAHGDRDRRIRPWGSDRTATSALLRRRERANLLAVRPAPVVTNDALRVRLLDDRQIAAPEPVCPLRLRRSAAGRLAAPTRVSARSAAPRAARLPARPARRLSAEFSPLIRRAHRSFATVRGRPAPAVAADVGRLDLDAVRAVAERAGVEAVAPDRSRSARPDLLVLPRPARVRPAPDGRSTDR